MLINEGYEADDIIATVVEKNKKEELSTYIVTGDKDIMQLVDDKTFVYNPGNKFSGPIIYDKEKVCKIWNVSPDKICDLLSIMGDASDNIPGVKGVGPKTASKLINDFGGAQEILEKVDDIANNRIKELNLDHRQREQYIEYYCGVDYKSSAERQTDQIEAMT